MKKLIAICAAALVTCAFAEDSYLYWMVDETVSWEESVSSAPTYTAARLGAINDTTGVTTYLSLYNVNADSKGTSYTFDADYGTGTLAALVGDTYQSGYKFYVELLNDNVFAGRSSSALDWNGLSSYVSSTLGSTSVPASGAWNGGTFTTAVIPEPTSGLLMLFGLSALALRRKRQVKA